LSSPSDSEDDDNNIRIIIPDSQDKELETLNFAFASWSWTHGVSIDTFDTLQQLLHSNLIETPLDSLFYSLKGIQRNVLRFLHVARIRTLSIRLKTAKLPT
jgi:hypothetical protein